MHFMRAVRIQLYTSTGSDNWAGKLEKEEYHMPSLERNNNTILLQCVIMYLIVAITVLKVHMRQRSNCHQS